MLDFNLYKKSANYSSVNGHQIAHWSAGKGEAILLIHGFPSAAWDWHFMWPKLKASYRLFTLDLLGYGLSDKPFPHQYSLLEQADIIESLLEKECIQQCHIIAHDYGNSVAQELLRRQYKNKLSFGIKSLCFLNGGLFSEAHRPLLTQKLLKGPLGGIVSKLMTKRKLNKSFTKIFGPDTPPKAEEIDILWQLMNENNGKRVLHDLLSYIDERKRHRDAWVEAMQNVSIPLRFINGVHDPISGQHMLGRYKELIPNADAHALNLGHYPQIEGPEQVLELYQAFLNENRDS